MENIAPFAYAKSVYLQLSAHDKRLVNPRGSFIDSPHIAYRRAILDNDRMKMPMGFLEGYIFEDAPDTMIIVYAVAPAYRNRGIAVQLIDGVKQYAFKQKLKLLARVEHENIRSRDILLKSGFKLIQDNGEQYKMEWAP